MDINILHVFTASTGLLTAGFILYLVRRDHLHSRYALWWIPAAIVIAILGLFPRLIDWIAPGFGISYAPIFIVVIAVIALVIKVLVMDIERSRNEVKLERLTQRLGMLEQELHELVDAEKQKNGPPHQDGIEIANPPKSAQKAG